MKKEQKLGTASGVVRQFWDRLDHKWGVDCEYELEEIEAELAGDERWYCECCGLEVPENPDKIS